MPTLSPDAPPSSVPRTGRSAAAIRLWIVGELARSLDVEGSSIDTAAPLESLGVDSLAAIGMTGGLAGWLDRDVPATLMWDYTCIDAIAEALADCHDAAPATPLPGIVPLQPLGNRLPLFCFPGERGHPVTFAPLAAQLGTEQPCFGLTVPGLCGEQEPLQTVEEIAAVMLTNLRRVQPNGPYQLAGYSFGGLLAYEAAQQLAAIGETVSLLAIYDTFTPAGRVRRPAWQQWAIRLYFRAKRPGRWSFLLNRLRHGPTPPPTKPADDLEKPPYEEIPAANWSAVRLANSQATALYQPRRYPGAAVLFRATYRHAHSRFYKMNRSNGWGAVACGGIWVIPLPGSHADLLNAYHAPAAAAALRPLLAEAAVRL